MTRETNVGGRIPGGVLIASSVLSFGAMLHHPDGGGATPAELARVAAASAKVHGVLIAMLLLQLFGVAAYARLRGLDRPLVLAGYISFGIGAVIMLPAPLLNGFVLPGLAARSAGDGTTMALVDFGSDITTAFAMFASLLISTGVTFFSCGLLHDRGVGRWLGYAGVVAGAATGIALTVGAIHLDVGGMTTLVATWSFWLAGLGGLMALGKA